MFDFIFDLFRREKPLYRWRERPSLSAFIINAERKQKPLQFWGKIFMTLGIYWAIAAALAAISSLIYYLSSKIDPVQQFLRAFVLLALVMTIFNAGLTVFSNFADRIVELFGDRLRFQESDAPIFYKDLEFFAFTQMIHQSSGARYPCVVFGDRNQETTVIGIPNSQVAMRVTEILSSRVTLRTDLMEMQLRDAKTQP